MTSVSTKVLLFSKSIDNKIFLFNWLFSCADFFGIFFVISWVFYDNVYLLNNFSFVGKIWVFQFIYILCPLVIIAATQYCITLCILMFSQQKIHVACCLIPLIILSI